MKLKKDELVSMFEEKSVDCKQSFKQSILKPTGRGGVYAARDYIHANSILAMLDKAGVNKSLLSNRDDLKKYLHPAVLFRLNAYTPCLAYRYDELKPAQQKALFEKPNYIATEKENGARGWLIYYKGKTFLFSRNYSDVDCSLQEYWDNILQTPTFDSSEIFAIDVEIKYEPKLDLINKLKEFGIETESKLEAICALLQTYPETARTIQEKYKQESGSDLVTFRLIYPLYFKGKNYLKRTLREGHNDYNEVVKYAQQHGLNVQSIQRVSGTKEQKEIFLNSILEVGGEGIVFHNLNSTYCTSENRDKDTFIKLKRSVSGDSSRQGIGDTIDGWISGFTMSNEDSGDAGLIGSFEISIYMMVNGVPRKHVVAYVPNIQKEMKKDCTVIGPDGQPTLKETYYNRVVEVDGQAISAKSRRLTHPRLIRFRFDKSKEECIYSEEFINSQMV